MQNATSKEYLTDAMWLVETIKNEDVILRAESALLYLQLFNGYLGESEIKVYSKTKGLIDNVEYEVVSSFVDIAHFEDSGILCSTLSQAVNDMLVDFDNSDHEVLAQALSNYYHSNRESFEGLSINPGNMDNFEYMRDWALEYYLD